MAARLVQPLTQAGSRHESRPAPRHEGLRRQERLWHVANSSPAGPSEYHAEYHPGGTTRERRRSMLDPVRQRMARPPDAREHDMPDTASADTSDTTSYEIRIRSELGDEWLEWFGGLRRLSREHGDTVLTGTLDQAALHAVLRRVRDLGLSLVEVRRIEAAQPAHPSIEPMEHLR